MFLAQYANLYDISAKIWLKLESCLAVADAKHQHQKQQLKANRQEKSIKLTSINFLAVAIGIIEYQQSFKCFDERSNINHTYQTTRNN